MCVSVVPRSYCVQLAARKPFLVFVWMHFNTVESGIFQTLEYIFLSITSIIFSKHFVVPVFNGRQKGRKYSLGKYDFDKGQMLVGVSLKRAECENHNSHCAEKYSTKDLRSWSRALQVPPRCRFPFWKSQHADLGQSPWCCLALLHPTRLCNGGCTPEITEKEPHNDWCMYQWLSMVKNWTNRRNP